MCLFLVGPEKSISNTDASIARQPDHNTDRNVELSTAGSFQNQHYPKEFHIMVLPQTSLSYTPVMQSLKSYSIGMMTF